MQVATTDLDGQPRGTIELTRASDGRARVDGQLVVAMRPIGNRVALIVGATQYCVAAVDYWHVMRASTGESA